MRWIIVLIMLLALPVLVLVHRQHYFMKVQGPLFVQVSMALDTPEFAQVDPSMTYADVQLEGLVAELPLRERARARVDSIRGVRCREGDNRIRVPAKLTASLTGSYLTVSGWLHDELTLRDVASWITAARPGLTIDTAEVELSPHVTVEQVPDRARDVPPFLRGIWAAIEVPTSLKITRNGANHTAVGSLQTAALKDAVTAALLGTDQAATLDAKRLRAGIYVKRAGFADAQVLPEFLRLFFRSQTFAEFEADAHQVRVTGTVTPAVQQEWMPLLQQLAQGAKLTTDLRVYASAYHFPNYAVQSKLAPDAIAVLRDVLSACTTQFEAGVATAPASDQPKLAAAAAAVVAAGPEAHVIVGAHMDAEGNRTTNETMARRRAEAVIADLTSKGVLPRCLEVAVFEPGSQGPDQSRRVELLLK
ncbi:MAG: hypothetical protein ACOYMN_10085 [Roseimicrobium sp.]